MTEVTTPKPAKRYRVSRQRQMRKWLVSRFGRKARRSNIAVAVPNREYRRPDLTERLLMWHLVRAGISAREIGRRLLRDHHTVVRHTAASRFQALVSDLALAGQFREARRLLKQHGGSPDGPVTLQLINELQKLARWRLRTLPPCPY
jgi:hypothetical protein